MTLSLGPMRAGLEPLEWRGLDLMFQARYLLFGTAHIDPNLIIIGLDEDSHGAIGKPTAFWHQEYALVVEALLQHGAAVVGLDFVLNPEMQAFKDHHPVKAYLDQGEEQLARQILGGRTILIEYLAPLGQVLRSADRLHFVAEAKQSVGPGNLVTDADGVVRLAQLRFSSNKEQPPVWSFAALIAMRGGGENVTIEGTTLSLSRHTIQLAQNHEAPKLRIDYPGPPGSFPKVHFSDLLHRVQNGIPLEEFQDKICLVGAEADSFQDLAWTPYSAKWGPSPGVEIHAATVNSLLTGRSPTPLNPVLAASGVGLLAVLCSLFCLILRPALGLPLAALATVTYLGIATLAFSRMGVWFPTAAPILAGLLGTGAGYLIRWLTLERQQRLVRSIFGRFVSPQVMENLLSDPAHLALGGTEKRVTILFSDINGFTGICEAHQASEVLTMLNRYFEDMVELIFEEGGYLKQFVGDEIMVIWGAPETRSDHAAAAVRTALKMVELLQDRALANQEKGFYHVKIGIHTGEVVAGNIGSLKRSEYAVVGDTVNLAARIEAKSGELQTALLVSEATRQEAKDDLKGVEWISRGVHTFKGREGSMELFEVRRSPPG